MGNKRLPKKLIDIKTGEMLTISFDREHKVRRNRYHCAYVNDKTGCFWGKNSCESLAEFLKDCGLRKLTATEKVLYE